MNKPQYKLELVANVAARLSGGVGIKTAVRMAFQLLDECSEILDQRKPKVNELKVHTIKP